MQRNLFSKTEHLRLPGGGELCFFRNWMDSSDSEVLFNYLLRAINWTQPQINIAGQAHMIPRKQAWYGYAGAGFTYSGTYFDPIPFTPEISDLKRRVEAECDTEFNSVLANLYRDQQDSVSWHADDEVEFGEDPIIASFSLGATRRFQFKPKLHHYQSASWVHRKRALSFDLQHGDLLLMGSGVQTNWLHCVPKERTKSICARINLTFRKVMNAELK